MGEEEESGRKERRLLVAVDESDESLHALSWSLNNLVHPNSKYTLILLYVKRPYSISSPIFDIDTPESNERGHSHSDINQKIERYSQEVANCILEHAKKRCKHHPHVKVETKVESGDPREVICEMAEKLDPHVLVMGSHGYGTFKRTFLGSVSEYCAQKVQCPVLIIKKPKPAVAAASAGDLDV